jgi:hypothetical protein
MCLLGALAFLTMCKMGFSGSAWIVVMPIIVSPVAMLILRITVERGLPAGLLDPRTQSWSFLFGDSISIPLTLLFSSFGWRRYVDAEPDWFLQHWRLWLAISVTVGVVAACLFHFVLDGPNYRREGHGDRLGSPTKLWHDIPVYFSFGATMCMLGIPVLIGDFTGYGIWVLVSFMSWLALAGCDATFHKLNPADLHPRVQDTAFA